MWFTLPALLLIRSSLFECNKVVYQLSTKIRYYSVKEQLKHSAVPSTYYNMSNKEFCLNDYDAIGFDLDNTLARYNLKNLLKMEYDVLAQYLVEHKNYDKDILLKPFDDEKSIDFIQRGLFVDSKRGNLLKLDSSGKIMKVAHGEKFLSLDEVKKIYGDNCKWDITNEFIKDFLSTWNGPMSEQMRSCLDYFDMPSTLVFARAVESLDKANNGRPLETYDVYPDILKGLDLMFTPAHFKNNVGNFFPLLKKNPDLYYRKCSPELIEWLKELKAKGKVLFVLTGSYVDYASLTASTCVGDDWKQYFDFIGYFSKKPGFFNGVNRPFLRINNFKEGDEISPSDLHTEQAFSQGNWDGLMSAIKTTLNKSEIRPLYIGDNFIQDIYTPSKYTHCDTVAVCEEQAAEGLHLDHPDDTHLKSSAWDSFFQFECDKSPTVWSDILKRYSKICVPSLDYLASNPIDKVYKTFNDEDENFNLDGFHPHN